MSEADWLGEKIDCLDMAVAASRNRWPELGATTADLRAHIKRLGVPSSDVARYGQELCLTLQCSRGDAFAIRKLESDYLVTVQRAIAGRRTHGALLQDAMQELRTRLLVGFEPRIARYKATGPLLNWLCVAARRTTVNQKIKQTRRREIDLDSTSEVEGFEERNHPSPYYAVAQAALSSAVNELPSPDRNMLTLQLVGVSVDRIGADAGVHRATAARRLAGIRLAVRKQVARKLQSHFRMTATEAYGVLIELADELDLTCCHSQHAHLV